MARLPQCHGGRLFRARPRGMRGPAARFAAERSLVPGRVGGQQRATPLLCAQPADGIVVVSTQLPGDPRVQRTVVCRSPARRGGRVQVAARLPDRVPTTCAGADEARHPGNRAGDPLIADAQAVRGGAMRRNRGGIRGAVQGPAGVRRRARVHARARLSNSSTCAPTARIATRRTSPTTIFAST